MTKTGFSSLLFLLGAGLALNACSPSGLGLTLEKVPSEERHGHFRSESGESFEAIVKAQQTSRFVDECDSKLAADQLRIAKAVDEKRAEIEAAIAQTPPSERYRRIQLGRLRVREALTPPTPTPGWGSYEYGWPDLIQEFDEVKNQTNPQYWIQFYKNIQSTLSDDEDRLVYSVNVFLDRHSGPLVAELDNNVKACLEDTACGELKLTPEIKAFASKNPYYNQYFLFLEKEADLSKRRDIIVRLQKWTGADLKDFKFIPHETVRRRGDKVLELPLNSGELSDSEPSLADYIERVWKSPELSLRIRWVREAETPQPFRILLEPGSGGRAFVRRKDREIHLFQDVRVTSLAHEIGHVLGFPDRYYTTWNPSSCKYRVEQNEEDLMSDSSTGSVVASDWETLRTSYKE